jgi:hypothetical protein
MIKIASKMPLLRYGVIILLICLFFSSTFYLYFQYTRSQNLRHNINEFVSIRENSALLDSCILMLYSADMDTRFFTVTGDTLYLERFTKQVIAVAAILDSARNRNGQPLSASSETISRLIDQKAAKTKDYIRLKTLTDSLIRSSVKNLKLDTTHLTSVLPPIHAAISDSIEATTIQKQNLLSRIARLFWSKKTTTDTLSVPEPAPIAKAAKAIDIPDPLATYSAYYQKLNTANTGMRSKERDMLLNNSGILHELIAILKKYKSNESQYVNSSRRQLRGTLLIGLSDFSNLSILTMALLIALIIILLYNLWKIFRNEKKIISYSKSSAALAANKSSFLSNMSHEIRTPLNSILGFAEQISNSPLSEEQAIQIKAIKYSSEMLLDV